MHSGYCETCNKRMYSTNSIARKLAKTRFPGEHMKAYACPVSNYYHIGHLTRLKLAGLE